VLHNDGVRYVRKGYGLVVACVITFAYFYGGPYAIRWMWPYIDGLTGKKERVRSSSINGTI
jgi:hypothetical protein